MGVSADLKVLAALVRGMDHDRHSSHAERVQRFYAPQAAAYDQFRERLLHGRQALIAALPCAPGDHIVELGSGTGRNLLFFGDRLAHAARVDLVDLCPALLEVARERHAHRPNVRVFLGDATRYRPVHPVDCVYFSYSLSMIPDWQAAIANAVRMLKPGGTLGVVDFHLPEGMRQPARAVLRRWFGHDGVHLSDEHPCFLRERVDTVTFSALQGPIPYLPLIRAPYYLFIGRKRVADPAQ